VEITKNGCIDTSSCYVVNSVSVKENKFENSLKLFPNPTTGEFQLVFSLPVSATITLMDVQGKMIESRLVSDGKMERFSLVSVESGIYFVRIESKGEFVLKKIVKE